MGTKIQSPADGLRTGARYLDDIRDDGRQIMYDGEIVRDVTTHGAFGAAAASIATLYDLAAEPARRDQMTYASPTTGRPVLRCYQIPRTPSELTERRRMMEVWAEATFGLMGRTPDHVASFLTGFAAKSSVFETGAHPYADNVVRFYEFARDNHLYVSYTLVPPQIDRSRPAHQQTDPTLYAGVVSERDNGIVIRGAQQLATGGIFSDYVLLSCIHPLAPGDEAYAISVAIPSSSAGLRFIPRRSYASGISSSFDYPLANRFDETDALVVFDDVLVPWERVFIYRNIALCRDQWTRTPAHSYGNHQAQIRYATKLRFLLGVMHRHCEITGTIGAAQTQSQLGEMAALATIVESMVGTQETLASLDEENVVWPARSALYAIMALQAEINPRLIDMARELSGGAMLMVPSSHRDYNNPQTAADLHRYVASPQFSSEDRVALLRLAWELVGSEFAGRHQQYEKFYGGPSAVNKLHMYRNYDFSASSRLVDAALRL
jgi:4-hydroxyphenylacetate 3-monooxygenase